MAKATTAELAHALLTAGGRSLWAELEGRPTQPEERRRQLVEVWAVRDGRAERMLVGCLVTYGRQALAGMAATGLRPQSFGRGETRRFYERLLATPAGEEWNLCGLARTDEEAIAVIGMMDDYLQAVAAMEAEIAADWAQDHVTPWLGHTCPKDAAQALAERIVRLATVREKLHEANVLMAGRGRVVDGLGGVGI